jgi:hypothetical protein
VERYTADEAAKHFCPPWRNASRYERLRQSITKLWGGYTCVIRQCSACGFAFGDPFIGGDEEFTAFFTSSTAIRRGAGTMT